MTDNTKSDQKPFIKEFVLGMLPREFVRTSFLFLFRPHAFFNDVKANNWDGKLKPKVFLAASLSIVVLLHPFIDSTDLRWYESAKKMDDELFLEFREAFPFTDQELQTMPSEVSFPGLTPASRRIEKAVGSVKTSEIANHLVKANPKVALALTQGVDKIKKYNAYLWYLMAPVIFLSWAIGALIIHLILRRAFEPYRFAFYLLIYFQGFWMAFSNLTVAFGKFAIPSEFSLLSLLFVLFELSASVAGFIHGCWICGFVYKRSIGRRILAFVPANVVMLATVFVFGDVLDLVVDYLP